MSQMTCIKYLISLCKVVKALVLLFIRLEHRSFEVFAAGIRFEHKTKFQNCFMINVLPEVEVLTSQKLQFSAAAKCTKLIMSCLKWC